MTEPKIDAYIRTRLSVHAARTISHCYERLHLQHPGLSHYELLLKIVADLQEFVSGVSGQWAERLSRLRESILRQPHITLGDLAFQLGLTECNVSESALGEETASMLRKALETEIVKILGYMPESSEISLLKRRLRDADLQTEMGYRRYLKSTFGVDKPLGQPQFSLENAVLRSRQEWGSAAEQVLRLGLPSHFQPEKNWDTLAALDNILRRTDKTAVILDAGAELYSVMLPCLFLYGYRNLAGINLVFDQPLRLGGILYEPGNITKTTYSDSTFDAITCLSVVEHGVDLEAYFREAARILKVGGVLITSTDYYASLIDTNGATAYGVPVHIFTQDEIVVALDTAKEFGLELTCPINLQCKDKAVKWAEFDLNYTFIISTLEKKVTQH